jgi:transcriptional regulator with XRE-family HTH domain
MTRNALPFQHVGHQTIDDISRRNAPKGTVPGILHPVEISSKKRMARREPHPIDKHVGSRVRMRRLMLSLSQEKLGDALGVTFQQVQKYEKGINRIGAGRLQEISDILQVPVTFLFEGAHTLHPLNDGASEAPSPAYVSGFLTNSDGLALAKAFMDIRQPELRRRIVDFVEEISGSLAAASSRPLPLP